MTTMFYKHWKKISLALTAFFWASCNNAPTSVDNNGVSQLSSSTGDNSSSSTVESSSSLAESSSEFEPKPVYGVVAIPCYEDGKGVKTNGEIAQTKLYCDDGVICKETEILKNYEPSHIPDDNGDLTGTVVSPDYGVIVVSEKTYNCDGVTYNEAEFHSRYYKQGPKPKSSSSTEQSSSSADVTCTPGDSTVSYYSPSYSADIAKMNAEERAKRDAAKIVDSLIDSRQKSEQLKDTVGTSPWDKAPQCLKDLAEELSNFVALYGAPVTFPKDEVCSDGTTRATKEYLEYLKMKEEWEKNKPALDEECQKIYEDKLAAIQQRINKCLNVSGPGTEPIECDLEAICPDYGIESKCSYSYNCNDGARCHERDKDGQNVINCNEGTDKSVSYTEDEFKAKYHVSRER